MTHCTGWFHGLVLLGLVAGGAVASSAGAAPLIFDPVEARGFTVFPDSHSKKCYIASKPRLAYRKDGVPKMSLIKFVKKGEVGADVFAGGHLQFTVELAGPNPSELNKVKRAVAAKNVKCTSFGALAFKSGTFSVVTFSDDDGLVREGGIVGAGRAPLMANQGATVAIPLTQVGATFLEKALSNPAFEVAVNFELEYEGLGEEYKGWVKLDYDRARTVIQSETVDIVYKKHKMLWWSYYKEKGEIREERLSDVLHQKGAIEIESFGLNEAAERMMHALTEQMVGMMTQVQLALPGEGDDAEVAEGKDGKGALKYGSRRSTKTIRQTGTYEYTARQREKFSSFMVMAAQLDQPLRKHKDSIYRLINLDDPDVAARDVYASLDIENADHFGDYINFVTVAVRKRHRDPQFDDESGDLRFDRNKMMEGNSEGFRYLRLGESTRDFQSWEYKTSWSFKGGTRWSSPWRKTADSLLNLAPPYTFRDLIVFLDPDAAEERDIVYATIEIKNRLGGKDRIRTVEIDPDGPSKVPYEYYHEPNDLDYEYRVRFNFRDGEKHTTDWTGGGDEFLNVSGAE